MNFETLPPSSHGNGVRLPVEAGEDDGHQGANGREKVPFSRGWKTVVNPKTKRKRILIFLKGESRRKTPTTKRSREERRKFEEQILSESRPRRRPCGRR